MGFFPYGSHISRFSTQYTFFSDSVIISAQPCAVFFSLWEGQKWSFSLRIAHIALFYTLIAPRDLRYLGQCAALRSLAQLTTPFSASGKAKNGFFSLRIAHIALLASGKA